MLFTLAAKNPYKRAIDFVVRFAQADLEHFRPGDWQNLQDDLLQFLGWPPPRRTALRRESLKSLQKDVAEILRDIARLAVSATQELPTMDSNEEQTPGRGIALDVGRIESLTFLLTQPPTALSDLVEPIELPLV